MGEVVDELMRGALETGVAVITPEMAVRDAWRLHQKQRELLGDETWEQKRNRIHPPRAPARPYRIRVDTGPVGYLWLEWLGACARVAGVAHTPAP